MVRAGVLYLFRSGSTFAALRFFLAGAFWTNTHRVTLFLGNFSLLSPQVSADTPRPSSIFPVTRPSTHGEPLSSLIARYRACLPPNSLSLAYVWIWQLLLLSCLYESVRLPMCPCFFLPVPPALAVSPIPLVPGRYVFSPFPPLPPPNLFLSLPSYFAPPHLAQPRAFFLTPSSICFHLP